MTSRALPQLEEDDRLLPMLSHLSKRYLGQDYANKKPSENQNINAGMIDSVSVTAIIGAFKCDSFRLNKSIFTMSKFIQVTSADLYVMITTLRTLTIIWPLLHDHGT